MWERENHADGGLELMPTRRAAASLPRRTFLGLLGAAVAAPWWETDLRAAWELGAPQARRASRRLSVGFLSGSERRPRRSPLPWERGPAGQWGAFERGYTSSPLQVIPATSVLSGDPTLEKGLVRIKIHGVYPAVPWRAGSLATSYLLALFPPPEPQISEDPLPFLAWSMKRDPVFSPAPGVAFNMPVAPDGYLELLLQATVDDPVAARGAQFNRGSQSATLAPRQTIWDLGSRFTIGQDAGLPRLQEGVYLLGFSPSVWDYPVGLPEVQDPVQLMELASVAISVERGPKHMEGPIGRSPADRGRYGAVQP